MANNQFTFASDIDRFMDKVEMIPEAGCWIWMAGLRGGYGRFKVGPKSAPSNLQAHRFSYATFIKAVPDDLQLDHLCRTTCCVNPRHLEPVTPLENVRRGNSGKFQKSKTRCPKGHEYSDSNTYTAKDGKRYCRECGRVRRRERYRAGLG